MTEAKSGLTECIVWANSGRAGLVVRTGRVGAYWESSYIRGSTMSKFCLYSEVVSGSLNEVSGIDLFSLQVLLEHISETLT